MNLAARNSGVGLCSGTAEAMLKQSLPSVFNEHSPGRKLKRRKHDEAIAEAGEVLADEAPHTHTPRTTSTNSEAGISLASGSQDNLNLMANGDIEDATGEDAADENVDDDDDAGPGDGRPDDEDLGMPTA